MYIVPLLRSMTVGYRRARLSISLSPGETLSGEKLLVKFRIRESIFGERFVRFSLSPPFLSSSSSPAREDPILPGLASCVSRKRKERNI